MLTLASLVLVVQVVSSHPQDAACLNCDAIAPDDGSAMLQLKQSGFTKQAPPDSALIVIDMQNDFIAGNLSVTGGADIIPSINSLAALDGWKLVAYTQDYHPSNHISFSDNSPYSKKPFEFVNMAYDTNLRICGQDYVEMYGVSANPSCNASNVETNFSQQLWPVHCVQGTWGQKLDSRLEMPSGAAYVKKGLTSVADSYGAFQNNFVQLSDSDLSGNELGIASEGSLNTLLQVAGAKTVYVAGLALDYCVKYSSLQALDAGFKTVLVEDASKPVDPNQGEEAIEELKQKGAEVVQSADVAVPCPKRGHWAA